MLVSERKNLVFVCAVYYVYNDYTNEIKDWQARRLSENALFPKLCVMLKKLSSKYQLYVCGNFLSKPWFWKKLLF